MVKIDPIYPAVSWPADEGVLGVVGVAPWATLDFCQQLYALTKVEKEWEYPRLIIDNNSKIPSRGRHLQFGERDPSPWIQATIDTLAEMGATVAVVPCNTAHILWPRWSQNSAIPLVSIIDATASSVRKKAACVALLGSELLCASGLYQQALAATGCTTVALSSAEQQIVSDCIAAIKVARRVPKPLLAQLYGCVSQLETRGVTTLILACTELSLLKGSAVWQGLEIVDSNASLAQASLEAIGYQKWA